MNLSLKIPKNVKLVAVTKTRAVPDILNLDNSILDIAENKIQEAKIKFAEISQLSSRQFTKHYIGHLQSNKVKQAVQLFDVIQTVDNIELMSKINQAAIAQNKTIQVMIQVNISKDQKKFGITNFTELESLIKDCSELKNIHLTGLMTILKEGQTAEENLNDFKSLQNLFIQINTTIMKSKPLQYLSMGMSDDYNEAIQAGSNMVRIGRLLFN